jgi:exosortase/archaeosortase
LITASLLLWFACLSVYCCSKQQTFFKRALGKLLGWGVFSVLWFFAILFMLGSYDLATSFFMALSFVMAAWLSIILLRGHYQHSFLSVSISGALVSTLIFGLGTV